MVQHHSGSFHPQVNDFTISINLQFIIRSSDTYDFLAFIVSAFCKLPMLITWLRVWLFCWTFSAFNRVVSSPNLCLKRWRPCSSRSSSPQWISWWPIWRACLCPREGSSNSRSSNGDTIPPSSTWVRRMRTRCPSLMWFYPSLWRYTA